jgi:regulator of sirC expression with transglutaminase-like and TPR domain
MEIIPGPVKEAFLNDFVRVAGGRDDDLATPALLVARLEYPRLDLDPYLRQLDGMGRAARARLDSQGAEWGLRSTHASLLRLNAYLFEELGFSGNQDVDDDLCHGLLHEVLDRRVGMSLTLGLVYIEVARRAGLDMRGVNFPGRFLVRCSADRRAPAFSTDLIVDPLDGGALLSQEDCQDLLRSRVGDEVLFDPLLLRSATKQQVLVRMLLNLKRLYVGVRSFPQARHITELLLALDPPGLTELRDRGLLAYHLNDFPAALHDLETYLRLVSRAPVDDDECVDRERIWEHVKALRRRVATLN